MTRIASESTLTSLTRLYSHSTDHTRIFLMNEMATHSLSALDSKCCCLASARYVLLYAVCCMSLSVCVCVGIAVIQVIRFDLPNTLSLNVVLWQFIFYFSFHLRIFPVLVCLATQAAFTHSLPPCLCLCLLPCPVFFLAVSVCCAVK